MNSGRAKWLKRIVRAAQNASPPKLFASHRIWNVIYQELKFKWTHLPAASRGSLSAQYERCNGIPALQRATVLGKWCETMADLLAQGRLKA